MKLQKTASGKTTIKMSQVEWTEMGEKAGWMDEAKENDAIHDKTNEAVKASLKSTMGLIDIAQQRRRPDLEAKAQKIWTLIQEIGDELHASF